MEMDVEMKIAAMPLNTSVKEFCAAFDDPFFAIDILEGVKSKPQASKFCQRDVRRIVESCRYNRFHPAAMYAAAKSIVAYSFRLTSVSISLLPDGNGDTNVLYADEHMLKVISLSGAICSILVDYPESDEDLASRLLPSHRLFSEADQVLAANYTKSDIREAIDIIRSRWKSIVWLAKEETEREKRPKAKRTCWVDENAQLYGATTSLTPSQSSY